ncbi:hypothetical protein J5H41_22185, partial [Aeromonas dhakensis]|uniref:hypothetical protein n=1 Tax=Aeromonas dhakensis TaxID=196024 RepID=UPI001AAE2784
LTSQEGTLSAKGTLDLQVQGDWQHQGQWGAGQRFNAGVTGQLNNRGALVSNGVMQLGAQRLENSGSVQSGQGLTLNTQGELRNTGMLASQGDLGWQGESLFNGGTVYSGGSQALTANSNLTNEYGTLLAERGATIKVNNGQLMNASGTIDGGQGDLYLSANALINKKQAFSFHKESNDIIQGPLHRELFLFMQPEGEEFIVFSPVASYDYVDGSYVTGTSNYNGDVVSFEISRSEMLVDHDDKASSIISLGNIYISSSSLENNSSIIGSAGDISVTSSKVNNVGVQTNKVIEFADYQSDGVEGCLTATIRCSTVTNRLWLKYKLSGTRVESKNYSSNDALISAGGNLTGTVAGMIDNVTVKAHAGPVSSSTQRPSLSLPQAQGAGAVPDLQGDAQYLAQQLQPVGLDNGVPLPDFQLPSGDKGLFTVNGKSDSPYLIEVNPLLANLGQAGNGMLDRIDAALQQQLQGAGQLSFDAVSGNGGIAQVAGQHADWALPGRASNGGHSPELQSLSGIGSSGMRCWPRPAAALSITRWVRIWRRCARSSTARCKTSASWG